MELKQARELINTFDFAGVTLRVKGLGVYFLSEATKQQIKALPKDQATAVNKAAWKEKRQQCSIANANSNFSRGNIDMHDIASLRYNVADVVAKETYKRMMGYV